MLIVRRSRGCPGHHECSDCPYTYREQALLEFKDRAKVYRYPLACKVPPHDPIRKWENNDKNN